MNFIWEKITEWLKGLLVGGIMSNLTGLFDSTGYGKFFPETALIHFP